MFHAETIAEGVTLYPGDCMAVLAGLEPNSVDSCVTDPPYHLTSIVKRFGAENAAPAKEGKTGAYKRASAGFMGKQWDGGEIAFEPETWAAVYRVLKPGGHLLAFGAPKNFGFMQVAMAKAGFEIRDVLCWVFGSGFPKSHDVSKGIDREAGAEREFTATGKPVKRIIPGADQAKQGWEKTNGRVYVPGQSSAATDAARQWDGWGTALKPAYEPIILARKPLTGTVAANVQEHGTGALNIDGCRVETDEIKELSGEREAHKTRTTLVDGMCGGSLRHDGSGTNNPLGRWPANLLHDGSAEVVEAFPESSGGAWPANGIGFGYSGGERKQNGIRTETGDSGSAARFFYSAKADADDRLGSKHPTVKPLDLMQYLVRLVTPKGGLVLDPFAGTGTTGEAAIREGMRAILIEREPEYQDDIRRRMKLAMAGPDERARESIKAKLKDVPPDHGPLFADLWKEPYWNDDGTAPASVT